MATVDAKVAFETLRQRVTSVGRLHQRCAIAEGGGRLIWAVGLPFLLLLGLEYTIGLPFYLRAPILPLAGLAALYLAWRYLYRALTARYSTTRAALLVEEKRPELMTRIVSALELYEDLEREKPRFDRGLVQALVIDAHESTRADDFCEVIDRGPAKKQMLAAFATVVFWAGAFALDPQGLLRSLISMRDAWNEVGELMVKASGATIVVEPLELPAYLVGSNITIKAHQKGFHNDQMQVLFKAEGEEQWQSAPVSVTPTGTAQHLAAGVLKSFDCKFVSGRIESERVTVIVTERPRIVNIKLETELPAYARKPPIIEPRSDGNMKDKLFGSSVVLSIEANKKIKACVMQRSYIKGEEKLVVGGQYARGIVRLDNEAWLEDESQATISETYTLKLTDEHGYSNEDASHAYSLVVIKDQAPQVSLIGIPHRSAKDEPHILEPQLGSFGVTVKAKDDCGVSKVTVHYKIESLETNSEKSKDTRTRVFQLPQAEISQLPMLRMTETGAKVGDRIVFWAEVEDAYDLEPKKGPHKARTPAYRMAVVTKEEMFETFANKDTWTPNWYDDVKKAALSSREQPGRTAPESEEAAKVAAKLLDAPQMGDSVRGADQQLIQDYFNSLNVQR